MLFGSKCVRGDVCLCRASKHLPRCRHPLQHAFLCSCHCPQVSQYLEGYLWPCFDPATSSDGHVMSILVMVNEKFREGVPAWTGFHSRKVSGHSSSSLPARLAVVCRSSSSCSLAVFCSGGGSCSSRSMATSAADNNTLTPSFVCCMRPAGGVSRLFRARAGPAAA